MQISETNRGGVLLISAAGRLDSGTAGDLEAVLPPRMQTHDKVVLDLSAVAYVSSAGLRVLLMGAKAARTKGHSLVLAGLAPSVREVFDISGFTAIFTIAEDAESALASLG